MWLNSKRFKMPFVEFSLDLIKQAMIPSVYKNYTDSQFHATSCLNTISLHSRPLNPPNLHTCHPKLDPVTLLVEIG